MNWADYDVFCHVVEQHGFSAAARSVDRPRSWVSAAVLRLEAELGARLFERTTRKLRLTEAGEALYSTMGPLFGSLRQAAADAKAERDDVSGLLRIASPYEFGAHHIAPVACALMTTHPDLKVQLDVQHASVSPLEAPYDIVFAMLDSPLPSSSIVVRRALMLERGLFAAPSLLARHGEPADPADLERLPLLAGIADVEWRFTDADGEVGRTAIRSPRLRSSNADARLQAAIAGLGVARITATFCSSAVAAGLLRVVLPDHRCDPLPIYALLPARRLMPRKVRRFLDALDEHEARRANPPAPLKAPARAAATG